MRLLLFLSLFFIPQAYAIPPPDLVINLVQAVAQGLGIVLASVFTLWFAARDQVALCRKLYPKRFWGGLIAFILLLLFGVLSYFGVFDKQDTSYKQYLTIEQVIELEKNPRLREWKLKILQEMKYNLDQYRISKGLQSINPIEISSIPPEKVPEILQSGVATLDVREENERIQFGLDAKTYNHRFGDIMNDIFPDIKKDTPLLVVCYSGTRGYLSAAVLSAHGFTNVSYVQGGLGAYVKKDLPYRGDDRFDFLQDLYPALTLEDLREFKETSIGFADYTTEIPSNMPLNLMRFDFETLTSQELESRLSEIERGQDVMLVCGSESTCFDAVNVAYLLEKKNINILGYYQYGK